MEYTKSMINELASKCHKIEFEEIQIGMICLDISNASYAKIINKNDSEITYEFMFSLRSNLINQEPVKVTMSKNDYYKSTLYFIDRGPALKFEDCVGIDKNITIYKSGLGKNTTTYRIFVNPVNVMGDESFTVIITLVLNLSDKVMTHAVEIKSNDRANRLIVEHGLISVVDTFTNVLKIVEAFCEILNFKVRKFDDELHTVDIDTFKNEFNNNVSGRISDAFSKLIIKLLAND